jgi:hypothetical protein
MARSKDSRVTVVVRSEAAEKPPMVTLKITVPAEVASILRVEALGRKGTVGQYVAELVETTPRRFVLSDRGKQAKRTEVPSEEPVQSPLLVRGAAGPYSTIDPEAA